MVFLDVSIKIESLQNLCENRVCWLKAAMSPFWTGRSRRIDARNSLTEKCEISKTCKPFSSDDGDQAGACGERHLFLTLPSPGRSSLGSQVYTNVTGAYSWLAFQAIRPKRLNIATLFTRCSKRVHEGIIMSPETVYRSFSYREG